MPLRFNQLVRSKKYKASLKKVVQSIISHKAYYRILNPGDTTKPGPKKYPRYISKSANTASHVFYLGDQFSTVSE